MFLTTTILVLTLLYIYLGLRHPAIALITCPFVAGTMLVIGLAEESATAAASAPAIFIAPLAAILVSRRDDESERWPRICAKWIIRVFLILLLTVTAGVVFGPLGVVGIVFMLVFIGSVIAYGLTSRHATATYVVSTIGSSMRQNLPLAMALESAGGGLADSRAIILRRIHKWLVQGYSLSESIKRGYPKCPGHAVAMIAAAERIDQLPFAIKAIEADMMAKADERRKIRPVHPFYPLILMTFMFLILLGLMTFVVPQFSAVLAEMTDRAELPAATRLVLEVSSFVAFEYGWLFGLLLALLFFVLVPVLIYVRFRPRRPQEPHLLSRIGDFIKWHLPILHRFEKNYSMVQVIELLRLSLNAGCTVDDAVENTLGLDVNNCFRKRLQRWLQKVERGDNIAAAVRNSRLGSALAWAFDEKVNQGNTLTILETLEALYRSDYSYCVNLARFIMWPCIILMMGTIVGFVVFAIFLPGIQIITVMMDATLP